MIKNTVINYAENRLSELKSQMILMNEEITWLEKWMKEY